VLGSACCGALLATVGTVLVVRGGAPPAAALQPSGTASDAPVEEPVVTFIGDSWTEGIGATALRGYADLAAEQLGWDHYVLGVGGSGYEQPGRGSTFDERIDRAVATDPDVIVVQGSINDRRASPDDLEQATLRTLGHLRSGAEADTAVLVLGASYTPGLERTVIDGLNDTIAAAAERVGLRFIDPAAANWNDPGVPGIWADDAHPNDVGHQVLADRLAPVLVSLLER
jgi:lysophospholipase L1-like esterase